MKELSEKDFLNLDISPASWALFITSPFCGTCQLAEQMLEIAEASGAAPFPVIKCRASEWPETVQKYRLHQVPCLIKKNSRGQIKILYAFESVTKIYEFLR